MLRDLNNPKEKMFVDEDASDNGAPLWEALSDSSGHKTSAPLELWDNDELELPIRQIN